MTAPAYLWRIRGQEWLAADRAGAEARPIDVAWTDGQLVPMDVLSSWVVVALESSDGGQFSVTPTGPVWVVRSDDPQAAFWFVYSLHDHHQPMAIDGQAPDPLPDDTPPGAVN